METTQTSLSLTDTRPSPDDLKSRLRRARELYLTALEEVGSVYSSLRERGARWDESRDVGDLFDAVDGAKIDDFDRAERAVDRQAAREADVLAPLVPESVVLR